MACDRKGECRESTEQGACGNVSLRYLHFRLDGQTERRCDLAWQPGPFNFRALPLLPGAGTQFPFTVTFHVRQLRGWSFLDTVPRRDACYSRGRLASGSGVSRAVDRPTLRLASIRPSSAL